MGQTSIDRLKDYLSQLSPQSQALLMREYERSIERNENVGIATIVLDELRKIVRRSDHAVRPRVEDAARRAFRMLDPFLIDGVATVDPGQIRRASLQPVWRWLEGEGASEAAAQFEAALAAADAAGGSSEADRAVRKFQQVAADVILKVTARGLDDQGRGLARIGPPHAVEDLPAIGAVLKAREALDAFALKLPSHLASFGDPQIAAVTNALNASALMAPPLLPFALSLVMQRLSAPWQIVRLAIKVAASDDEIRVAASPCGVAVTMAISDIIRVASDLRSDIRSGAVDRVADQLKTVHDGIRGLRTELDIRNDSTWGRQLAAIRTEISRALQSEIESVPGRVRRLLRQRPDKDVSAQSRIDPSEVDETAALIAFVAVCRTYASELAINEVTLRTYSELQQYVEKNTDALVQSLRHSEGQVRAFRHRQAAVAIRFCDVLFGHDYAVLMGRAAENAMLVPERKPAGASR